MDGILFNDRKELSEISGARNPELALAAIELHYAAADLAEHDPSEAERLNQLARDLAAAFYRIADHR